MSVSLPNGALVAIAASYGTIFTISVITNANPAVATCSAGHGLIAGDVFEITSGWSGLDQKIVRVLSVSTNDVTLEGIDTSSASKYPTGGGVGSGREVLTWTQLQQILTSATDGGEQQFLTYQFLESDSQKRIPTFKNAAGLTFSVADDPTLAGYMLAATANDDRAKRALRISLPAGSKLFYNAFISLNKTPSLTINELQAVEVTVSQVAEVQRYAT